MNIDTKDKILLALLAVFLGAFLVSIVLGVLVDVRYLMISAVIAILVWVRILFFDQRKRKNEKQLFDSTLADCPGGKPYFFVGSSFGWPTYTITFTSVELMDLAIKQGNIENFKKALAVLHRGTGFRASRAVTITAIGHIWDIESTLANGEKRNSKFLTKGVGHNEEPLSEIIQSEQEQ